MSEVTPLDAHGQPILPPVDFTALRVMLEQPVYRETTWSAHCGCRHEAGADYIVRCPTHAKLP